METPAEEPPPPEPPAPPGAPYSAAAFAALPDEAKRDVYFNARDLLPEGFDPMPYSHILHTGDPVE